MLNVYVNQDPIQRAAYTMRIAQYPSHYLLFGDESAICERSLQRKNARSPRGHRSTSRVQRIRGKRYSILPVVSQEGVLCSLVKEGCVRRKKFVRFLRTQVVW